MNSDTWKNMTLKQRVQWILQYYGLKAACAVVVIGIVIYLIFSMMGGNEEECGLSVLILDDRVGTEKSETLKNEMEELLGCPVEVVSYTSTVVEQMQAFSVRTTAGGIDLMIAPENEMRQLNDNHYFSGDYRLLTDECRYEKLVYEEAAMGNAAEYIGVVKTGENQENATVAMEYLFTIE